MSLINCCEKVKEWLVSNNIPGQDGSMYAEMMRKEQQSAVENKKRAEIAAIVKAAESENAAVSGRFSYRGKFSKIPACLLSWPAFVRNSCVDS